MFPDLELNCLGTDPRIRRSPGSTRPESSTASRPCSAITPPSSRASTPSCPPATASNATSPTRTAPSRDLEVPQARPTRSPSRLRWASQPAPKTSRPLELAPQRSSSSARLRSHRRVARRALPNRVPSRPSRALQVLPRPSQRLCSAQPRRPPPRARATYPVLACPLSRLNNNNSKLRLLRRRLPHRLEPSRHRHRSRRSVERGPLRGRNSSNSSSKEPRRRVALARNHQRQRRVDPFKRIRNRCRQGRARVPARTPSSSRNPHRLHINRLHNAWGTRSGPRHDEEALPPSRRRRRRRRRLLLPLLPFNRILPPCPPPLRLLRRPSLHANRHRWRCRRLRRPRNNRRSRR